MPTLRPTLGVALAFGSLCILGVMPVVSNSRPADFGALGFAFWLSIWQTVFALPLVAWEARRGKAGVFDPRWSRRGKARAGLVTLVTGSIFGLSTYLYVLGVEKAGAVNAAIAIQAYPVCAILVETVFLKRRKTAVELLLTAVLCGALFYLGTGGTFRMAGISPWFLAALGVPLLWSIAHVIIREELANSPITPAQVTLSRVAVSALFLGVVIAVIDPTGLTVPLGRSDFQSAALVMGAVYYAELIVWFYAVRHISVSLASSLTTPWPVVTMVLGYIVLGTAVEPYQIGAFAVIAACIYGLISVGLRRSAAAAEPA